MNWLMLFIGAFCLGAWPWAEFAEHTIKMESGFYECEAKLKRTHNCKLIAVPNIKDANQ